MDAPLTTPTTTETPVEPPFVLLTRLTTGALQVRTNLKGEGHRMAMLWMLEMAKLMILTQPSDDQRSTMVAPRPGAGRNGFLRKIRG